LLKKQTERWSAISTWKVRSSPTDLLDSRNLLRTDYPVQGCNILIIKNPKIKSRIAFKTKNKQTKKENVDIFLNNLFFVIAAITPEISPIANANADINMSKNSITSIIPGDRDHAKSRKLIVNVITKYTTDRDSTIFHFIK
jgi:hypothetical protein